MCSKKSTGAESWRNQRAANQNIMANQRIVVALVIVAGFAGLLACRKTAPSVQLPNTNSNAAASPTQDAPVGGVAPAGERFYFRGTIANNLKVEMNLVRDGDQLNGTYFYPRVGQKINLKGTIDKADNVDLRETDDGGKETGVFKGKWKLSSAEPNTGLNEIEGKWTRPDGTRETSFQVTQQPINFTSSVSVVPKIVKEVNKEKHYSVNGEYPQISGDPRFDKFNREARNLIMKDMAAFKTAETSSEEEPTADLPEETQTSTLDIAYDIRYATDDLISVEFGEGQYSRGAAHPNSATAVLNFDVRNGKKLSLADLFSPNSKYLDVISGYCIKALQDKAKKDNEEMSTSDLIKSGASARPDNYRAVAITKKGLWVTFDPYQVAPYAAGPQYVLVPYSALKDIIKPNGPIGNLGK
jgi:Protein of unknown function (DUF3298)/Deacetylase PdaC